MSYKRQIHGKWELPLGIINAAAVPLASEIWLSYATRWKEKWKRVYLWVYLVFIHLKMIGSRLQQGLTLVFRMFEWHRWICRGNINIRLPQRQKAGCIGSLYFMLIASHRIRFGQVTNRWQVLSTVPAQIKWWWWELGMTLFSPQGDHYWNNLPSVQRGYCA